MEAKTAFMSIREAAERWGISQSRVATLCADNRIKDAAMAGNMWIIPVTAKKPDDAWHLRCKEESTALARPFLKWAGGKGQLLSDIERYYPFADKSITKYAEPFVGGGAVLFDILNKYDVKEVYISDTNYELINAYCVVRDCVDDLLKILQSLQDEYIPLSLDERKAYYLGVRDRYNALKTDISLYDNVEKAALLIFLNKTCFNGLYRVNKKGYFNVPMGAYKNPMICDVKNLLLVSEKLQGVTIVCDDYKKAADFIDEKTFVYFDPPYRPLNTTSSFTAYTENVFDDTKQKELAQFVKEMHSRGAKVAVSNSDPKNVNAEDNFFDELYDMLTINRVSAARMINSKGTSRGRISELLICNFA